MKVKELIELLQPHSEKELFQSGIQPENIKNIEIETFEDNLTVIFRTEKSSLIRDYTGEGSAKLRYKTSNEIEKDRIDKIIDDRSFNYCFSEGELVKLDPETMNERERIVYSEFIGKIGIIIRCRSDIHSWDRGCSYSHIIKFNDKEIGRLEDQLSAIIPPWIIKSVVEEVGEKEYAKLLKQYHNIPDESGTDYQPAEPEKT